MKQTQRPARRSALGLACGFCVATGTVFGLGCERTPAPTKNGTGGTSGASITPAQAQKPGETPSATGASVKYTVRGVVKQLPIKDNPRTSLQIHHEAIPTFAKGGKVIGMHEMTMEFPLGPGVSLEGIKVGDKVEFDFEVVESPSMRYYMTRIVALAAETKLNLAG